MKSERRHELQHNDLADWMTGAYETIAPHRNAILAGAIGAVVAVGAWAFWRGHSEGQAAEAWDAYGSVLQQPNIQFLVANQNPQTAQALVVQALQRLDEVAQKYPGTAAAEWAQIGTADLLLEMGERNLLGEKKGSTQNITNAMEKYQKVASSSSNPLAKQRALFGQARALESLCRVDEAKKAYEELKNEYPKGMFNKVAEDRAAELAKPELKRFYDDLKAFEPKPIVPKATTPAAAGPRAALESMGGISDNPPDEKGASKDSANKKSVSIDLPAPPPMSEPVFETPAKSDSSSKPKDSAKMEPAKTPEAKPDPVKALPVDSAGKKDK